MKSLKEILAGSQKGDFAIPHFNVSCLEQLRGIVKAAKRLDSAVIIGLSENEAEFFGYELAAGAVGYFRDLYNIPIYISADHHQSYQACKKAILAGFDGVHIDASKLSFSENILLTQKVVVLAKTFRRGVSVEGELGKMTEQKVNKNEIKRNQTKPEQIEEFIRKTGADRLAVVVGSVHGLENEKVHLDFPLLDKIKNQFSTSRVENGSAVCLTLHGGSGVADEDVKKALPYFSNIHINTGLRMAYKKGLEKAVKSPSIKPYEYLPVAIDEVQKVAEDKIKLFKSGGAL